MRIRSINTISVAPLRSERPLPPGTGILIVGATSLLMWGVIAGIAAVV